MFKSKGSSAVLLIVLILSIILGNFSLPVFAYDKGGVNFEQTKTKTKTLSDTSGTILNKLNSVSKSNSILSQDLSNKKQNLSGPKKKLGTDLLKLVDNNFLLPNQNRTQLISEMKKSKQFVAKTDSVQNIDKRVVNKAHNELVYVYISLDSTVQTTIIDSLAWKVTDRDENNHLAVALVDVNKLETLASLNGVKSISSVLPSVVNSGSVVTEGDIIHQTAAVRSTYAQSGAGIKIGVISDGVDNIASSKSSGDLPAGVTVLSNSIGGDEGTAMLEIIYDMTPSASLYFHDTGSNIVAFNSAIDDLVATGVNVIVDDTVWPGEPFFEDGTIASHIISVLATKNIVYISSAGNYAKQHYQGDYYNGGYNFNDFSRGSAPTYKDLYVKIPSGANVQVVLQWNDSFGYSNNDYDLMLVDENGYGTLAQSLMIQNGSGNPLESLSYTNTTGGTIEADIWVYNYRGLAATKTLELFIYTSNGASNYSDNITPVDSIFGHAAVPGVIAVGAINANNPTNIEPYSSQGPVTIIGQGQRAKPDITGIDCVSVTGAGGFPSPFCGTSAAAPAVAAIVAQLWGQYPTATNTQIKNYILNSAVDLGTAGTDMIYGHGRADSLLAFQVATPTNPTTVNLGTAGNFSILSKTKITTTGATSITGDIGISPPAASYLEGFSPSLDGSGTFSTSTYVTGKIYAADYHEPTPTALTATVSAMEAAYTDASGRTQDELNRLGGTLPLGTTFTRGIYKWGTNVNITGDITLSGNATDVFIFIITGNLDISASKKILLSGGVQAKNVFWVVAGTTTIEPGSTFEGNILGGPGASTIAMQSGAILHGRALGQTDVTLIANTITAPSPSSAKAITVFTISSQVGTTTIDEGAKTIAVTMPSGTVVTALVPTITITGASVSPLTGVAQNFTSPVTYTVTAADGLTQIYTVTVTIATPTTSTISGTIKYYDGVKVIPNVTVILENGVGVQIAITTTDANGAYQFTGVTNAGNYVVKTSKSDNTKGVTSADQTKIGRHIVGLEIFDTIYKKIAGDVNNSGGLTSADQTKIGRFIVGLDNVLTSGNWKFYSSDTTLTTQNYLNTGLTRTYTNLTVDTLNQDFVGIKMGDVNNSWVSN